MALEYAVEDEPLGTGGAIGFAGRDARGQLLRAERRLAARGRPRRAGRLPPLDGREGDDPADARRRPEPVRARPHGRRRPSRDVPREAAARGDRHRPHQRRASTSSSRRCWTSSRTDAPSRSSARCSRARRRRLRLRHRAPGLLARRRNARVVPAGAPRRARADLHDGGGRRARRRLHARRRDRRGASRARSSCRPSTSGPARSWRTARGSAASRCSARGRGSREARRRERRRRRADDGRSAGPSVVGSIVGDDARARAGCELHNLAVVGPGATSARATCSTTVSASAPSQHDPGRGAPLLVSGLPDVVRAGSRSRGAGSSSGPRPRSYVGKLLFVRAGESLSLQYHEVKDESWLVHEGRARLELGEVGGELEIVEIAPGDAFRFRPGTVHRVTALEDTLVIEVSTTAPRRRRAARGPLRPRGYVSTALAQLELRVVRAAIAVALTTAATTRATPASSIGVGTWTSTTIRTTVAVAGRSRRPSSE